MAPPEGVARRAPYSQDRDKRHDDESRMGHDILSIFSQRDRAVYTILSHINVGTTPRAPDYSQCERKAERQREMTGHRLNYTPAYV